MNIYRKIYKYTHNKNEYFDYPIEIVKNLYIGSAQSVSDLNLLKSYNIKSIVNITNGVPNYFPTDFNYYNLRIGDHQSVNILEYIDYINAFIDGAIKSGGCIIHCRKGVSRSASFILAYLVYKGVKLIDAWNLLKLKRCIVNPNVGFKNQLILYNEYLNGYKDTILINNHFIKYVEYIVIHPTAS